MEATANAAKMLGLSDDEIYKIVGIKLPVPLLDPSTPSGVKALQLINCYVSLGVLLSVNITGCVQGCKFKL